jgi:hypothetical protein
MIHISLEEVQEAMPLANIYAWRWTWHPELGVYRAMMWMELPYKDSDKVRYDKYIPVGLAPSKGHVLRLLKESLKAELQSSAKRGLTQVEGSQP